MDRNWGPGFSSIFNKAVLDIHLGRFKDAGTFLHVIPLFAKHLCTAPSKRCSKACASIALPLRSRQLSAAFFQPLPSHPPTCKTVPLSLLPHCPWNQLPATTGGDPQPSGISSTLCPHLPPPFLFLCLADLLPIFNRHFQASGSAQRSLVAPTSILISSPL